MVKKIIDLEEVIKTSSALTVLYVEDNEETRKLSSTIFEEFFQKIIIGVDGEDGFIKFQENDINLVITDINMPKLDGLQMSQKIKSINPEVPIFVLSAYNEPKYFMDSIKYGIEGYFLKPIDLEQFYESLDQSLKKMQFNKEDKEYRLSLEAKVKEQAKKITQYKIVEKELLKQKDILGHQATHDVLTGLANKTLFEDRLKQATLRVNRKNTKVALFFIDLDKFKAINDSFGHKTGDYILQIISERMSKELRKEDLLARIGGDEFTLIIEDITDLSGIKTLAEKLINTIETAADTLEVSASIGISIFPDDCTDSETLIEYADIAMYRAKESTGNIIYYSQMGME